MDDFEIIDVHVHLARTGEEEKKWMVFPGRRRSDRWGTPEGAYSFMQRNGISKMVVQCLTPRYLRMQFDKDRARLPELPEEQHREEEKRIAEQYASTIREFNKWGCEMGNRFPQLIPFISVAKELGGEGMPDEVALRASQGAKGVKLHPGAFNFFPDDNELWPMYEKCQKLGLPVLTDSGPWPPSHVLTAFGFELPQARKDYNEPKNFARVLEDFPRLTLVLAHLGSAWWDERVELAQKYHNVYFDTSQGFSAPDRIPYNPHRGLAEEDVVRVMRKIGLERIMFGSDGPADSPQLQLEQLLRLPLSDEEKRLILSENAKCILHV